MSAFLIAFMVGLTLVRLNFQGQKVSTLNDISNVDTITVSIAVDDKHAAYNLALDRFRKRNPRQFKGYADLKEQQTLGLRTKHHSSSRLINSIRIPEAEGHSSLSVIARALAGCHPDGFPCCQYPGSPAGSCPRKGLECPSVVGCMGHIPQRPVNEPLITAFQHPESRVISLFHSFPPHRPIPENDYSWDTFRTYVKTPKYQNIVTRMMNFKSPYDDAAGSLSTAKQTVCKMDWYKIEELPILSALLLYESLLFRFLRPNPVVFGLPASGENNTDQSPVDGLWNNISPDSDYNHFRKVQYPQSNGTEIVRHYNKQDMELYEFSEALLCTRVVENTALVTELRQRGIAKDELSRCEKVLSVFIFGASTGSFCSMPQVSSWTKPGGTAQIRKPESSGPQVSSWTKPGVTAQTRKPESSGGGIPKPIEMVPKVTMNMSSVWNMSDSTIPPNIYMYWDTGWHTASREAKLSYFTMRDMNPGFRIFPFNRTQMDTLTERSKYIPDEVWRNTTVQARSDVYRTFVIYKFGGIWADASLMCNAPLVSWLDFHATDLFTFRRSNLKEQMRFKIQPWITSWFLAAPKKSYFMEQIFNVITSPNEFHRFTERKGTDAQSGRKYFWWHAIVSDIAQKDKYILDRINNEFWGDGPPHCSSKVDWMKEAKVVKVGWL
jgi:hypothetical protein